MININASQLDTLIGSRPDTVWRGNNFWRYFGTLCKISLNSVGACQTLYTPSCTDTIDYGAVGEDYTEYSTGRGRNCCERVTRWFVDAFRWLCYGQSERNYARGRSDEYTNLAKLDNDWAPIRYPIERRRKMITKDIQLKGIPDAMRLSDGMLIEVKSRRNRLFPNIPSYEMAQLYAYMYLFERVSIIQIQFYNNKFRVHTVEWDQAVWDRIVSKMILVREAVELYRATPCDQALYTKDPQAFVNKYMRHISG